MPLNQRSYAVKHPFAAIAQRVRSEQSDSSAMVAEVMFAAFALGVSIADHPAVTGSAPDTNFQPWQIGDEPGPDPCGLNPLLDCLPPSAFRPASYRASARLQNGAPQDRFPGRCLSQGSRCSNFAGLINNVDSWLGLMGARVRQTAHDTFGYCVGAAIFGGGLPRFVTGCGSALVYQSGRTIFRIW